MIAGLLILDTLGISIGALVAALGVIGLAISFGAQPFIRDIIGYISFVFADNFRVGEEVAMVGMRGELLKFELRGVVLRVNDDDGNRQQDHHGRELRSCDRRGLIDRSMRPS
ncbi:MAG: mechanosensitive ion channel [Actinomycetota bacterium]|nr:mechanosensitive ion channel [Actinomycetota bacterium]